MRFLLKSNAALRSRAASAAAIRNTNKEVLSQTKKNNAHNANTSITGRAWGQQCSPDCGCVLRFELQLSNNHISPELSTTETVASATYHAKRVMVTKSTNHQQRQGEIDNTSSSSSNNLLRPLLTSEHASKPQRPILTTCTCNTLHELAQQVVNHLPGKTLQQLRNETELNGVVGTRTSMAFRHTVLSENILPLISSKTKNGRSSSWKNKFGVEQKQDNNNNSGVQEMNTTERYGHCYDLVEDSLLSMIYERSISPRKDDKIHAYSPTMGGSFHLYSPSRRQQHKHRLLQQQQHDVMSDDEENDTTARGGGGNALRRQDSSNWLQQTSPSSYFLFGDDNYPNNKSSSSSNYYSDGLFSLFVDYAKESIFGRDDNNDVEAAATTAYQAGAEAVGNGGSSSRPSDYLQLLDMYGDNHSDHENEYNHQDDDDDDDEPLDDWLDYVDTMQSAQGQQTTTSG